MRNANEQQQYDDRHREGYRKNNDRNDLRSRRTNDSNGNMTAAMMTTTRDACPDDRTNSGRFLDVHPKLVRNPFHLFGSLVVPSYQKQKE